jgi:hypothetical protein
VGRIEEEWDRQMLGDGGHKNPLRRKQNKIPPKDKEKVNRRQKKCVFWA